MKILIVGDVHATDHWKKSFNRINEYDHIVQLGDWFDSFHNDWKIFNQVDNFYEAVEYKKKYPNKIHLLLGNHDLNSYLMGDKCSGHQELFEEKILNAIDMCIDFFDIGVELNSYVFSHAGFSNTWMRDNNFSTIDEINNEFHNGNYIPFRFYGVDCYGNDAT